MMAARMKWLAVPALTLLGGCNLLDPRVAYREAAQKLNVTLDRVEPKLDLAFPLDRSRLRLKLTLGVDNPSDLRLAARSLGGDIRLERNGRVFNIGRLSFEHGVDLPAHSRVPVIAEISIAYGDLKDALPALQGVVIENQSGVWTLDGTMQVDVLGIPFTAPLRTRKHVGH